jgi:hypothetical protein
MTYREKDWILNPDIWLFLKELLELPALSSFFLLPTNFLIAIAVTIDHAIDFLLANKEDSSEIEQLITGVSTTLSVIFTKFSASFRPTIQRYVTFMDNLIENVKKVRQTGPISIFNSLLAMLSQTLSSFFELIRQTGNQKMVCLCPTLETNYF